MSRASAPCTSRIRVPSSPSSLMGNLISCRDPDGRGGGRGGGGKVVLADGTVHELDRPTPVAELMLEHPRHFVVDLRSLQQAPAAAGVSKVAPLPADHLLQPGEVYAMLPMAARGKTAGGVSADEARQVLAAAAQMLKLRRRAPSALLGALWARTADKGSKVAAAAAGEERKLGGVEEEAVVEGRQPEFLMRQYSSKRWKPTLGTIVERNLEKKVPHWLF